MIWSRDELLSLSEKDLCTRVLVPLFQAMGYQDVRYYHGPNELGKDIVMWKTDELRGRINYAVIAKAEKITGAVAAISGIALQLQQALGSNFVAEQTQENCQVDHAILLTSHDITEEAHAALAASLRGANTTRVTKIDGEKLWSLLKSHLPYDMVFASLAAASKELNDADPHFAYILQTEPGEVRVTAFPKGSLGDEHSISYDARFPDTPEGKEEEAAFRLAMASGRQTPEIQAKYIEIKGLPRLLAGLLMNIPTGTVALGPRISTTTFSATLILKTPDGEEKVLFPLIEFGTNYIGEEEVNLTNEQQPIPFKFTLTIRRTERAGRVHFDFTAAEHNAFSLLQAIQFQMQLRRGGSLIFQDYNTGQRFGVALAAADIQSIKEEGQGFLALLQKLVWIESKLAVRIPLPSGDIFTAEDVQAILELEKIMAKGVPPGRVSDVQVRFKPGVLREIIEKHPDGFLGALRFVREYRRTLLGVEVSLGPIEIASEAVRIDPATLEELTQGGRGGDAEEAIRLIPAEGEFTVRFANWGWLSDAES